MKFCMPHWNSLREAIDTRGLTSLISEGGERAAKNMVREIEDGPSIDSFDPLMHAHNAILGNAMQYIIDAGGNPIVLFAGDAPDEVQCPICYLNYIVSQHAPICPEKDDPDNNCMLNKPFEWMIDRASDDALEHWKALQP